MALLALLATDEAIDVLKVVSPTLIARHFWRVGLPCLPSRRNSINLKASTF